MKTRLTVTIGALLLVGMLLVNLVLMIFWKHDALQRESDRDQTVLACIQTLLLSKKTDMSNFSEKDFAAANFYNGDENSQFLISLDNTQKHLKINGGISSKILGTELITTLLASAVAEAKTGRQVSRSTDSLSGRLPACKYILVNAQPVVRQGQIIGAVAVARSLDSVFQALWVAEKTVLVYILINLLFLVVIGFFRVARLVGRPVERLMELADQYNKHDPFLFAAESSSTEFGRLSSSLNSMLTKIEHDRQSLRETVAALETANRKLKRQQKEMIQAEKLASVGRMAAGLAHEIGNPLGVVQGYLGMLAQSKEQSDKNKDFIRRSEQELHRVYILIRQLLDFSRAAKGRPEKFSLHELLQSVVEMVSIQNTFRDIELTIELTTANDTVYADREQLRQVFVNCLLNSADAVNMVDGLVDCSVEQKIKGRITLSICPHEIPSSHDEEKHDEEETQKFLCVCIADNGTGLTEEQLSMIFDPFYTTKEPGKGTGLGLSVSRSIIENIGGGMEMKSRERQGSVMSISLPLAVTGTNND